MGHKRTGVMISGAYGMNNAGDDAVLSAMLAQLRHIGGDMPVTVIARRPKATSARYGVRCIHPLAVPLWAWAMRRVRLFISGGGSLLQDVTSKRSLRFYLLTLRLAKRMGCAVQLYGCGIGPLSEGWAREKTAAVLNRCADAITLRDRYSMELLETIGVTEPRSFLAADPTLSLPPNTRDREQTLGFVLRGWAGFWIHVPEFAAAARHVWEVYHLRPVFLCMTPEDKTAARSVCAELEDIPYTVRPYIQTGAKMTAILSMRLHGLIFALRDGTPAAGVSYDPKVDAFCREAGLPVRPLETVTERSLCALTDEIMSLSGEDLSAAFGALREREKVNGRVAAELLSEE